MQFLQEKCIGCRTCARACPERGRIELPFSGVLPDSCAGCSACADACPARALKVMGEILSPKRIAEEALRDADFYKSSGGGVTFSGGEPLLQMRQIAETCDILKRHRVHCAVETSGNVSSDTIKKAIDTFDLFLFDLKAADGVLHKKCTGHGNAAILQNLKTVAASGKPLWVRIPWIPGWNDSLDDAEKKAAFIAGLKHVDLVELMPYHNIGVSKYDTLGEVCRARDVVVPSEKEMKEVRFFFQSRLPDIRVK